MAKLLLGSRIINNGLKPSTDHYVTLVFEVVKGDKQAIEITPKTVYQDITSINPDTFRTFCHPTQFAFSRQSFFPSLPIVLGDLEVTFPVNAEISLKVTIWENDGRTEQAYMINEKDKIVQTKKPDYSVYS